MIDTLPPVYTTAEAAGLLVVANHKVLEQLIHNLTLRSLTIAFNFTNSMLTLGFGVEYGGQTGP